MSARDELPRRVPVTRAQPAGLPLLARHPSVRLGRPFGLTRTHSFDVAFSRAVLPEVQRKALRGDRRAGRRRGTGCRLARQELPHSHNRSRALQTGWPCWPGLRPLPGGPAKACAMASHWSATWPSARTAVSLRCRR